MQFVCLPISLTVLGGLTHDVGTPKKASPFPAYVVLRDKVDIEKAITEQVEYLTAFGFEGNARLIALQELVRLGSPWTDPAHAILKAKFLDAHG